jgi:hypothetical protein
MTVAPSTLKKAVCVATFPHPTQKYVFIAFFVLSLPDDGDWFQGCCFSLGHFNNMQELTE